MANGQQETKSWETKVNYVSFDLPIQIMSIIYGCFVVYCGCEAILVFAVDAG